MAALLGPSNELARRPMTVGGGLLLGTAAAVADFAGAMLRLLRSLRCLAWARTPTRTPGSPGSSAGWPTASPYFFLVQLPEPCVFPAAASASSLPPPPRPIRRSAFALLPFVGAYPFSAEAFAGSHLIHPAQLGDGGDVFLGKDQPVYYLTCISRPELCHVIPSTPGRELRRLNGLASHATVPRWRDWRFLVPVLAGNITTKFTAPDVLPP